MGSACVYVSHVSISYFCTQIVMNHIVNGSPLTWVFGFMVCLFLLMPEALHKTYCKTVHARSDFCSFPSREIIVRMVDLFLHPSSWFVCFSQIPEAAHIYCKTMQVRNHFYSFTSGEIIESVVQLFVHLIFLFSCLTSRCLNQCTYCKTKHARGDLGSYPPEEIVERARQSFSGQ